MKDEWREKLTRRVNPMDLYKLTPGTNCGECGFAACLAFATQVVVGQAAIDGCPYLVQDALEPLRVRLLEQHREGIGVKREGFEKSLEYLRARLNECDFRSVAPSIGALYHSAAGEPALELPYFGRTILATREGVRDLANEELNPWEKIFIYNYIIDGAVEPSGDWVGMESLPNSVSKVKSLKTHCEDRLAAAYGQRLAELPEVIAAVGKEITAEMRQADFAAEFSVLPKLSIRVLWWAEDPDEGFEGRVKFLFDSTVPGTLDLESLLFACERLTDLLLDRSTAECG